MSPPSSFDVGRRLRAPRPHDLVPDRCRASERLTPRRTTWPAVTTPASRDGPRCRSQGVTADWRAYTALAARSASPRHSWTTQSRRSSRRTPPSPGTGSFPAKNDDRRPPRLADTGVALGIVSNPTDRQEQLLNRRSARRGEPGSKFAVRPRLVRGRDREAPPGDLRARPGRRSGCRGGGSTSATPLGDGRRGLGAGVRPVHLDPHGFCPIPDDHDPHPFGWPT